MPDGCGLADENQKRGLESILSVGIVAQHTLTHAENHRPVPAQQGRERSLVPLRQEALQQIAVAVLRNRAAEAAEVVQQRIQWSLRHRISYTRKASSFLSVRPEAIQYNSWRNSPAQFLIS
jgi:hypothetical protein